MPASTRPPGSEIRISAQQLSRQVEISIEDDGPGLPVADPEILFEKFQRGAPEGAVGGIGLGLAICRTILGLHKGRIWAENRAPHGAAFRFTLPLPASTPAAAEDRRIRPSCCRAMTVASRAVLVVEDEPQLRRVLRTLLELENFRVIEAENAERGLLEARTHKPDLLIVDLGLPDRDGIEVITGVRSLVAGADHRAVGAQRRVGQGRGAGGRRRRLHHQAVRRARARRPRAGRAAPQRQRRRRAARCCRSATGSIDLKARTRAR